LDGGTKFAKVFCNAATYKQLNALPDQLIAMNYVTRQLLKLALMFQIPSLSILIS
jgi:hypothetical protein